MTFTYQLSAAGQTLLAAGKDAIPAEFHEMVNRLQELENAGGTMTLPEDDDRFDGLDTRGFVEVN